MKLLKQTLLGSVFLLILSTSTSTLRAQVTIGSGTPPTVGALLDLKTQQAGNVTNVGDDSNITSTKGGLLLPRVKIKNPLSLACIGLDDATLTAEEKMKLAGLLVYNIHVVPGSFFTGVYTWTGTSWGHLVDSKISTPVMASQQPKAFSFYETGEETVEKLKFEVIPPKAADGTIGSVSYKWYQLKGSNLHATVGELIGGATDNEYLPPVIKGTTRSAANAGMYRYYCVATGEDGSVVQSNIAEVAVGCGAKDNFGNWTTFMCFNLGADITQAGTIEKQKTYQVGAFTNTPVGLHTYIPGEENVYGDLFQWGRIPDGHEKRTSDKIIRDETLITSTINPAASQIASGNRCVVAGVYYPYHQIKRGTTWEGKFIISKEAKYNFNWHPSLEHTVVDMLWRTTRFNSNDPCAMVKDDGTTYKDMWYDGPAEAGTVSDDVCQDTKTQWRLATIEEWGAIYKGGLLGGLPGGATANTWEWYNGVSINSNYTNGFEIKPDGSNGTTTLYLPTGGSRRHTEADFYYQGTSGVYWTATISGINAYTMSFARYQINPSTAQRASGYAIRCVKNQ